MATKVGYCNTPNSKWVAGAGCIPVRLLNEQRTQTVKIGEDYENCADKDAYIQRQIRRVAPSQLSGPQITLFFRHVLGTDGGATLAPWFMLMHDWVHPSPMHIVRKNNNDTRLTLLSLDHTNTHWAIAYKTKLPARHNVQHRIHIIGDIAYKHIFFDMADASEMETYITQEAPSVTMPSIFGVLYYAAVFTGKIRDTAASTDEMMQIVQDFVAADNSPMANTISTRSAHRRPIDKHPLETFGAEHNENAKTFANFFWSVRNNDRDLRERFRKMTVPIPGATSNMSSIRISVTAHNLLDVTVNAANSEDLHAAVKIPILLFYSLLMIKHLDTRVTYNTVRDESNMEQDEDSSD